MEDFYSYMCPLPEERLMRQKVIERVSALITELWPSAKVPYVNQINVISFNISIIHSQSANVCQSEVRGSR